MQLTTTDAESYRTYKVAIATGLMAFAVAGEAARIIKERKWYLADGYKTWSEFVEKEYGWSVRYVNALIMDVKAVNSLPVGMRKLITSHQAATALSKIEGPIRQSVIEVVSVGGTKPVTAAAIKAAAPPPRPKPVPPAAPARPAAGGPKAPARPAAPAPVKPEPKKTGPKAMDKVGIEIPAETADGWKRAGEVSQLQVYVNALVKALEKARDEKDALFVELDFTNDIAMLRQLRADIDRAFPYAVCTSCQGKLPEGCATCRGRGFFSEFYYKTFIPVELRKIRESNKS